MLYNQPEEVFSRNSSVAILFGFGSGIGVALPMSEKRKIIPKFSFFAGYLAFIRTAHVFYEHTFLSDLGIMIVVPIGSIITIWD